MILYIAASHHVYLKFNNYMSSAPMVTLIQCVLYTKSIYVQVYYCQREILATN